MRSTMLLALSGVCAAALGQSVPALDPQARKDKTFNNQTLAQPTNAAQVNLAVMIHGWNSDPTVWANAMETQMLARGMANTWVIWKYDWNQDANTWTPQGACGNGVMHGWNLARQIFTRAQINRRFTHVHLIAHSAGSWISDMCTRQLTVLPDVRVHQTFRDAYTPAGMYRVFGEKARGADHYYHRDAAEDTQSPFTHANNLDVSGPSPYGWHQPIAGHGWPCEWYTYGMTGQNGIPQSGASTFGYGYSYEVIESAGGPWPASLNNLRGFRRAVDAQHQAGNSHEVRYPAPARQVKPRPISTRGSSRFALDPGGEIDEIELEADTGRSWAVVNFDTRTAGGLVNSIECEFAFTSGPSPRRGVLMIQVANAAGSDWEYLAQFEQELDIAESGVFRATGAIPLFRELPAVQYAVVFVLETRDGLASSAVIRNIGGSWLGVPDCRADLNADGLLDFNDYLEFLNEYNLGSDLADLNDDGEVDFSDYLEFLNSYNSGC